MRGCAAILDPSQIDRLVPMATKDRRLAGNSRLRRRRRYIVRQFIPLRPAWDRDAVPPMMVTSNSDKGTTTMEKSNAKPSAWRPLKLFAIGAEATVITTLAVSSYHIAFGR